MKKFLEQFRWFQNRRFTLFSIPIDFPFSYRSQRNQSQKYSETWFPSNFFCFNRTSVSGFYEDRQTYRRLAKTSPSTQINYFAVWLLSWILNNSVLSWWKRMACTNANYTWISRPDHFCDIWVNHVKRRLTNIFQQDLSRVEFWGWSQMRPLRHFWTEIHQVISRPWNLHKLCRPFYNIGLFEYFYYGSGYSNRHRYFSYSTDTRQLSNVFWYLRRILR